MLNYFFSMRNIWAATAVPIAYASRHRFLLCKIKKSVSNVPAISKNTQKILNSDFVIRIWRYWGAVARIVEV
jgi:hypothetical protein